MNNIVILYGSSGGNTESVAKRVRRLFNDEADLYNIDTIQIGEIKPYKFLILGTSTTGTQAICKMIGTVFCLLFRKPVCRTKPVAIFTLGDSASFSSSFSGAMKVIYDAIKDKTKVVGFVNDEDYTYDDSATVIDGRWAGLPVDEGNEYGRTDARLEAWVEQLKKEFV